MLLQRLIKLLKIERKKSLNTYTLKINRTLKFLCTFTLKKSRFFFQSTNYPQSLTEISIDFSFEESLPNHKSQPDSSFSQKSSLFTQALISEWKEESILLLFFFTLDPLDPTRKEETC